ncbi:MAG TPA: imidazoleglycerol-phosphate dehydratase HisB [Candidatus Brocadiia bacterium]|nr:imidazoleglycerol-phosphate dehydratase HisB [Candidatus Brocadiia bacterium]
MAERKANIERKTRETNITLSLDLDGQGEAKMGTGVGFLDHMLELFARHGLVDLQVTAQGDTQVDAHHTTEDVGIVLGQAIREALGSRKGLARFGDATVPMDEALASVALDLGGRGVCVFNAKFPSPKVGDFDSELVEEFFRAVASNGGMNIHVNVPYGGNTHHISEAVFKAFARAFEQAARVHPRVKGVPSTKGVI